MRLYDIHTHILHDIDDGAKSLEESKKMLEVLKNNGITDVFLTPHYYPFDMPVERFAEKRQRRYNEILPIANELGLTLHIGAEVYYSDVLLANNDISALCMGQSNYIMIELPFCVKNAQIIINSLYKLCARFSVHIIIAHIDRYPRFFKKRFLREIDAMGGIVQVDTDSLKKYFLRKKILKFIKLGFIQCAGTDCHGAEKRTPELEKLKESVDEETYFYLLNNIGEKINR